MVVGAKGFLPFNADQAFLRATRDQFTPPVEDHASIESAGVARPRAVHVVEQPVVNLDVIMEPESVIKARTLHTTALQGPAMGQK